MVLSFFLEENMIIKLEKLTGHAKDAIVGKVLIEVGQDINAGDEILSLESNKGAISVKSKASGKVEKIYVHEGDKIFLEDKICDVDGEEQPEEKKASGYTFGFAKQRQEKISCDIAIVGGGPGGYVAAIKASQLGKHVVIIEKDRLGGTCLNRGCIPTKALVKSSQVFTTMKHSEDYGILADQVTADMDKIIHRKNEIVDTLVGGIEYLMENHHVTVVYGDAVLLEDKIVVDTTKVKSEIIAEKVVLATGSEPVMLNMPGTSHDRVLTSVDILELKEIPDTLTIIGGGIIGMEFAFIFASLGTKVSVIEFADDILTLLDDDVLDVVKSKCREMNIKLYTSSRADEIIDDKNGGLITKFVDEKENYITSDYVLMAVGRRPRYDKEALEILNIEIDEETKGIKVDEQMMTTNPKYYAIGDVTNIIQLAHVASHQGIVAVEAISGLSTKMSYDIVPSGIFVTPEIGIVGKTEKALIKDEVIYSVGKFPFASNGKALANGSHDGFVKIIFDEYDVVIGAAIIGYGATDLIAVITPLIEKGVKGSEIDHTIFAHPTTAESIHESFLDRKGASLHHVSNTSISNIESTS